MEQKSKIAIFFRGRAVFKTIEMIINDLLAFRVYAQPISLVFQAKGRVSHDIIKGF